MQHEGRAGKWKRVKLFKEKLANAPQKNIPEKPQIDNGQWTMDKFDERNTSI